MFGDEEIAMQVQDETLQDMQDTHEDQDQLIEQLQQQVAALTAENSALHEQLARKERFTAMIVHDLRNPLSPILSYAQMLSRHRCEEQASAKKGRSISIERGTSIILSQARRLTRLVSDLLDSTQLNAGRFTLERERCDLSQLIEEMVDILRPIAPYHTFIMLLPTEPVIGNWDSGRLQQVLGNLLDNAVKYSDEGTVITTQLRTTVGAAHVSVHNQGLAIPFADREHLFQPYARLKTTRARTGLGLGLYIAHSIIEAHGGHLFLEPLPDDNPSSGTTFSFDLPI
jgi:signal transduction histidine kinase